MSCIGRKTHDINYEKYNIIVVFIVLLIHNRTTVECHIYIMHACLAQTLLLLCNNAHWKEDDILKIRIKEIKAKEKKKTKWACAHTNNKSTHSLIFTSEGNR